MRTSVPLIALSLAACASQGGDPRAPLDLANPDQPDAPLVPAAGDLPGEAQPDRSAPFPVFADRDAAAQDLAIDIASDFLALPKIQVDPVAFDVLRVRFDRLGWAHVHVRQVYDGVPVFGGEAIVHLEPTGLPLALTDDRVHDVVVDSVPTLDRAEGIDRAVTASVGWSALTAAPDAQLFVLRHEGQDHLVWRVQLERIDGSPDTSRPVIFVDAHRGDVVWSYDNLKTASGTSDYDGTVTFADYQSGSTRYLEDTSRNIGTYTFLNTTSSLYYVTNSSTSWTSSADQQGVSAHWAASRTYDYYDNDHGRSGINGSDGPGYISSLTGSGSTQSVLVNYGTNYVNAFWDGTKIVIGDGDGSTSDPLTALDIVGHELTHGVIDNEADLTYSGESGAMNESIADVFGAMVDLDVNGSGSDVWKIGEDAWTPNTSGDALRYMDDPTADGYSYDHYSTRYTGSSDNGGVHTNSGIGNLAFYLASEGGTHPDSSFATNTVSGMGAGDAAEVWYLALTSYMTSSSDFGDSRDATIDAATEIWGSSSDQVTTLEDAWAEVGVGSSGGGGGGGGSGYCSGYATNTSGSLSGTGSSAAEPGGTYYYSSTSGTHEGCLDGPSSADFDLYFYKWSGRRWSLQTSSTSSSSQETITSSKSSGYYYFLVTSYSGSGSYDFGVDHP